LPRSACSMANASPGNPSVTRLVQRIRIGRSGRGNPRRGQKECPDLSGIAAHRVFDELADVVIDTTPLARHISALSSHSDTDVGSL
jgi:hypothetical protein